VRKLISYVPCLCGEKGASQTGVWWWVGVQQELLASVACFLMKELGKISSGKEKYLKNHNLAF